MYVQTAYTKEHAFAQNTRRVFLVGMNSGYRKWSNMIKLIEITLCAIQLVCLYMVLKHEKYYLVPIQMVMALIVMCI